MSWVYSGTLPSVEDKSRYTAPRDAQDESETAIAPMEAGRYARECCHARDCNPYAEGDARAEWFEGWDGPDLEDGDDTAPDYDADEIADPFDCLSIAQVAERLESFTETAMLQFAMLKHELRGMTLYVETLRLCCALQSNLKRRATA